MRFLISSILMLALCITAPALAENWAEEGDAPELPPAQETSGTGSFDAITGAFGDDDADLYCIVIDDPSTFTATTCDGSLADTRLYLFALDGTGITFNDDAPNSECSLRSRITGVFVTEPGYYILGICEYSKDPYNSDGLEIWNSSPFGEERAPDGPGMANPILASWEVDTNALNDYTIFLTSASFCTGSVSVETSSWGMIKGLYR